MANPVPVMMMVRALDLGGTERQLTEMARNLDPARFQVHVGTFHASGLRAKELWKAGIPVVEFPVRSFARPGAIGGALAVGRYLDHHSIRLVHTFDVPLNIFGVPVARFFRTPVVVSSQRAFRDLTPGFPRQLLRLTDRIVDAVVVNCRAVACDMIERDGTPRGLIHWCPNGIDTSIFYPGAASRPEGAPAELVDASLVIGCICALRPEKDLGRLLEAFRRVRDLRPGLRLAIVGSGPELPKLEEQRRALDLERDCAFIPATGEPAGWFRAMDIFVLPSLSEALSNSLMEAMACGCAVAASNVGGNPELVTAGETGLLFEPGSVESLTEALYALILDEGLRSRLSAAAAVRIAQKFSIAASAGRLASIYESLLR